MQEIIKEKLKTTESDNKIKEIKSLLKNLIESANILLGDIEYY